MQVFVYHYPPEPVVGGYLIERIKALQVGGRVCPLLTLHLLNPQDLHRNEGRAAIPPPTSIHFLGWGAFAINS